MPIIKELYRYPVKGLSPEALHIVQVTKGKAIAMDRCIALAHLETEFDPVNPKHQAKTAYLMLMRNEKLAALHTTFDSNNSVLQVYQNGEEIVSADLDDPEEIQDIETFFERYLQGEVSGKPKLVFADSPDHTFSDVDAKVLSCINLESVKALEEATGETIDPLRFRANIYFYGTPAWQEMDWIGKEFELGTAIVRGMKRTQRCAATNVNPKTAQRDLNIPQMLFKNYGHADLGIYLEVIKDGQIAVNDNFYVPNN